MTANIEKYAREKFLKASKRDQCTAIVDDSFTMFAKEVDSWKKIFQPPSLGFGSVNPTSATRT